MEHRVLLFVGQNTFLLAHDSADDACEGRDEGIGMKMCGREERCCQEIQQVGVSRWVAGGEGGR